MQNHRVIESPYLSQGEAAAFIRRNERTFRGYVKKYRIPQYGPGRNQYLVEDLRVFMENPFCFLGGKPVSRHRSSGFTPVSV